MQHGRDNLAQRPGFSEEYNAVTPSEEFVRLDRGADFGWPYCYHEPAQNRKILAPEYGGDGKQVGRCASKQAPLLALPGHSAPNDLLFYTGTQFPERYRNGAFIAFHGSWNRAPLPQGGYNVTFVPFQNGAPAGQHEVFAARFTGPNPQPRTAEHRPVGLALGPDGSLYIADSIKGRVWRVMYTGTD